LSSEKVENVKKWKNPFLCQPESNGVNKFIDFHWKGWIEGQKIRTTFQEEVNIPFKADLLELIRK
jgi:hypothetical protein